MSVGFNSLNVRWTSVPCSEEVVICCRVQVNFVFFKYGTGFVQHTCYQNDSKSFHLSLRLERFCPLNQAWRVYLNS